MITVTIEDKDYQVCQTLDDISLITWSRLMSILYRREYIIDGETISGEQIKRVIPRGQESDKFMWEMERDICVLLSGIPQELFDDYEDLLGYIYPLIGDITTNEQLEIELITYKGVDYTVDVLPNISFGQWADLEDYAKMEPIYVLAGLMRKNGLPYNKYQPDWAEKIEIVSNLPAREYAPVINGIQNTMDWIRSCYKYVYGESEESDPSDYKTPNIQEHSERFGWQEVIASLAEKNVFNDPKGTLYGVRNADTLDVLEYLNVLRSKQQAEHKDFKLNNSKNKQSI